MISIIMLLEFIFIFVYINCQILDDRNGMRVFACMNVMDKKYIKQNQPNVFSPTMLSCYLKITESQIEQVLHDFGAGVSLNSLDQEEIDELTNVENLKSFPENELKKKSAELEAIIEEFKKFDKDFSKLKESKKMENDDNDSDDDIDAKNFKHGSVKKGKRRQIKFDNGFWVVIICSGFLFFMLFISWITSSPEDNNNNKKEEKVNEKENKDNKDDKEKMNTKENEKPKKE
jgi:hypothetical protein